MTKNDEFNYLRNFAADPASSIDQTATIRSEARLSQILAQPPNSASAPSLSRRASAANPARRLSPTGTFAPSVRRLHGLRWAAIPVAAAAVIAAGIIWPQNPVTPAPALTAHAALATWQPEPTPLSPNLLEIANQQCRKELAASAQSLVSGLAESPIPGRVSLADPTIGDLVIAEQRGDWGFLSYAAEVTVAGQQVTNTGSCLVWFPATAPGQALVLAASFDTGGAGTLGSDDAIANEGEISRPTILQSWGGAAWMQDSAGNWLAGLRQLGANFDDGTAFQAVIGNLDGASQVEIGTADTSVVPTVAGNWFAAWWPITFDPDSALGPESITLIQPDGSAITYFLDEATSSFFSESTD